MKTIVIDPGHGGYDPGAVHGNAAEKDFTLHIGLQVRDLLQKAGFSVVMTRTTDNSPGDFTEVNADLNERCRISNAAGADVFLSIHVNAGGGNGAEIYANGDGGPIAGLAQSIINNVSSVCGVHGQAVRDGGANGTQWRVICGTHADAMLVEVGFIDSDDLAKIEAHQDEFAPLIAHAFCDFYGVPYEELAEQASASTVVRGAADKVIAALGADWNASGDADVQAALHYGAAVLRVAAGEASGTPIADFSQVAGGKAANLLGAVYTTTQDADVQYACHYAASAIRSAKGISA